MGCKPTNFLLRIHEQVQTMQMTGHFPVRRNVSGRPTAKAMVTSRTFLILSLSHWGWWRILHTIYIYIYCIYIYMYDRPLGTILFRFYFLISSFIFHSGGLFISKQLKPIKKKHFQWIVLNVFKYLCLLGEFVRIWSPFQGIVFNVFKYLKTLKNN